MSLRVCSVAGCPALQAEARCPAHRREADQARGSKQERGYGAAHQAERKRWSPLVATGSVKCWRCREHIPSDAPWDLGHSDTDRSKYRGPEHVACNRATRSPSRISPDA